MKKRSARALRVDRAGIYAVAIALAATVAACGASPALRVASSGDYPPFSLTTPYGAIVGFDVAVAAQFTQDSGRGMHFVPLRWPRLLEQAQTDAFDIAMSGVTMRADRVPRLYFSRPYAVTGAVVVVRRERQAELGTLAQLDRLAVRIAVNRGGHLERVARARFDKAQILTLDDNRLLDDLVLRGEVDAAVSEQLEVRAWPVDAFAVVGPFTRDRKAYAVAPQHIDVLQRLNDWLVVRERDGWLNDERRRWLGDTAAWTADEACFEAIAAAIDLRMELMPRVAAAKRQRNLPIADIAQEKRVLAEAAEWAAIAGLHAPAAVTLFEKLIFAAKEAQRASLEEAHVIVDDIDLDSLRDAIAFYGGRIIDEAAGCKAALKRPELRPALEAALRGGDSRSMQRLLPAAEVAPLLAAMAEESRPAAPSIADEAAPESAADGTGSYVEFCVPPNSRFDRQGYSAEPVGYIEAIATADGAGAHSFRAGRTRIAVDPGRHQFAIYVNGSSADPRAAGGPRAEPAHVEVDVPSNGTIGIRYTPVIRGSGQIELRWSEVPGAAPGPYHGLTRFDAIVEVYDPSSANAADRCPW
jgi:cyclohexadienyl dehydratase